MSSDNCARMFRDKLHVSLFPDNSRTIFLNSSIVSPLRLCWVTGACVFRCNLPPTFLAEWPGSFTCRCGNTGVERRPNKSQHTKLTLEKKILPSLLLVIRTCNLSITSPTILPTSYPGSQWTNTKLKRSTLSFASPTTGKHLPKEGWTDSPYQTSYTYI